MALQGDGRFFVDLNGISYRDDMLADADFVRRWRFCDEVMGVRVRNALLRTEQTAGVAGPRTTEQWTYGGRAGESVRIVLSDDQLVIRLFAPGNLLVAQSASGSSGSSTTSLAIGCPTNPRRRSTSRTRSGRPSR